LEEAELGFENETEASREWDVEGKAPERALKWLHVIGLRPWSAPFAEREIPDCGTGGPGAAGGFTS
jgi:hypothetical protein